MNLSSIYGVCDGCVDMCHCMCGGPATTFGHWFSYFTMSVPGTNSAHQGWPHKPLPTEPSSWPSCCFLLNNNNNNILKYPFQACGSQKSHLHYFPPDDFQCSPLVFFLSLCTKDIQLGAHKLNICMPQHSCIIRWRKAGYRAADI